MSEPIIQTEDLTKYYGTTRGIENVHLSVEQGEVFGFLGPNGAGKSTTIRLILHLLRPTAGRVVLFNRDLGKSYTDLFRKIGNVPGEFKLYENITGRYFLDFMQQMGFGEPVLQDELLGAFNLDEDDLAKPIKHYSHGMKQKLVIIQAMQHKPDLLIMDEPSEGLDPLNKNTLYEFVFRFKEWGKTVFFSSHYLAEVEKVGDRVGLVQAGRLITVESISALKKRMLRRLEISLSGDDAGDPPELEGCRLLEQRENRIVYQFSGDLRKILARLAQLPVENIVFPEPSLEDMFMSYYRDKKQSHAKDIS